jgi:hypothetical protein
VQVRDVAWQILQVLKAINGVLIPPRDQSRMEYFMVGYGVMVAYLHDIGMADLTEFGRAMHPEFAAQAVLRLTWMTWLKGCGLRTVAMLPGI